MDGQRRIVNRLHAQRIDGQPPADHGAPVLDDAVVPFEVVGIVRVRPPAESKDVVMGGEGPAVVPLHPGPQVEEPRIAVRRSLPGLCRGRYQVVIVVLAYQRFGDEVGGGAALVYGLEPLHVRTVHLEEPQPLTLRRRRVFGHLDADGVDPLGGDFRGREYEDKQ